MKIRIANEVAELVPRTKLGVIQYHAHVEKSDENLLHYLEKTVETISNQYDRADIADIPPIKATREAYKALGKSPSQYRNAAEAMLRRIVKGNGLYKVNNIVEVNNLISIRSGYSIGSYDKNKLRGCIELRKAPSGERYEGIGKKDVNLENLPVLYDEDGAFGNPSSDSVRTMVQEGDREIISFIYAFGQGDSEVESWLAAFQQLLESFTNATNIQTMVVTGGK